MAVNIDVTLKRFNGTDNDTLHPTTTWTQVESKPATFTPTSHTHGNITDGGQITATQVAPASTDVILISDTSNGGKIERGIAIGTSTTTFLRNDGTFATPAGGGNVSGPASSTDNNVPQWNGTTGTLLKAGLGIADSTSAGALGTTQTLATERDVYYGTPTINNSKAYTSGTNIYAPSTGGTAGQILVSAGSTTTPEWANITAETEWELIRSVYSTTGTTLDPLSGNSPLSITNSMEYKVVFSSHTTGEDNDGVTFQLNGVTSANYTWVFHRTQVTGADTATITASADSSGATFIDTGTFLNSMSATGVAPNTITRVEFTIAPWDTIASSNYYFAIQGKASSVFSSPGSSSGNAVTNFSGSFTTTTNSLTNILITHNQGAGTTDKASAYVYQRARGY
jgi:hypothetical protein